MTECRLDCLYREGHTTLLYAPKVARTSINDEHNIAGLSTESLFVCEGGTIWVTNSWFNNIETKPRRVKVLFLELFKYGFGARGMHDCVEKVGMEADPRTWRVIHQVTKKRILICSPNVLPETRTWFVASI